MGFQISHGQIRSLIDIVEAIRKYRVPNTLRQIHSFLSFTNCYRRFIPNFSEIVAPLTDMIRGRPRHLNWSEPALRAFEEIKQLHCQAPVLYMPRFQYIFFLQTDASGCAMGAVLFHKSRVRNSQ